VPGLNRTNFGLLVKTLRNSSVDENGNRWTRESLSSAIHLTANQLGRLERGDRKYLDSQTLQLLAKSFNLTNLETREFLFAATGLSDEELFCHEEPAEQLSNLTSMMRTLQVPAYVMDVYSDLVAVNTMALKLYRITPDLVESVRKIPAGMNLLYFIYSADLGFRETVGSLWREAATMAILEFRRSTLRYRYTDYFNFLIRALLKERQFYIDWYSGHRFQEQPDLTYELFEYKHPNYGPLRYIATETIINTRKGELNLILYNPANTTTVSVFSMLHRANGNTVHRMAEWPEKNIPR
jgi:transcriptional regulator with XRE-family HTH domain